MTMTKDRQFEEIEQLRASGTEVHLAGPSGVPIERLMDPSAIGEALELGAHQGEVDAPAVLEFWAA